MSGRALQWLTVVETVSYGLRMCAGVQNGQQGLLTVENSCGTCAMG